MRIECEVKSFKEAAEWAKSSLADRAINPAHSGIRLHVEAPGHAAALVVSAASQDTSSSATVEADADDAVDIVVSGNLLVQIAKSLTSKTVVFTRETDDNHVVVTSGSAKFRLPLIKEGSLPMEAYPKPFGTVSGKEMLLAAKRAVGAAASDISALPVLASVQVTFNEEARTATFAATDRYRMSVTTVPYVPVTGDHEGSGQLLVPGKLLSIYASAFSGVESVEWARGTEASDGVFGVRDGVRETTGRMMGGSYPEWQKLLPAEDAITMRATFNAPDLTAAVKRVALVSEEASTVRLTIAEKKITIVSGASSDSAYGSDMVNTDYDGEPFEAAYNSAYLVGGLGSIRGDALISGVSSNKPVVATPTDTDEDGEFLYLVMPVRI